MKKDYDKIAKIEKEISKKYGKETILNPKSLWSPEKEEKHLEHAKKFYEKNKEIKSLKKEYSAAGPSSAWSPCDTCGKLFMSPRDQVYMNKYECCDDCFIVFVEDREERWLNGWRPDKQRDF